MIQESIPPLTLSLNIPHENKRLSILRNNRRPCARLFVFYPSAGVGWAVGGRTINQNAMMETGGKISFFWTLDSEGLGNGGASGGGWYRPGAAPTPPQPGQSYPTTSVHLAQWQAEPRAPDEVLVRVKGQPRVQLNRVFEVMDNPRRKPVGTRVPCLSFFPSLSSRHFFPLVFQVCVPYLWIFRRKEPFRAAVWGLKHEGLC